MLLSEKQLLEPEELLVAPIAPGVPEAICLSGTEAFWHRPGYLLFEGQSWESVAKAVGSPEELNRHGASAPSAADMALVRSLR